MKIYVDEMPINIVQRVIHCEDGDLCGIELLFSSSSIDMQEENSVCPVAEREAELIKRIKLAIRKQVHLMEDSEHCYPQNAVYWQDIVAILDQVERGNSNEINND